MYEGVATGTYIFWSLPLPCHRTLHALQKAARHLGKLPKLLQAVQPHASGHVLCHRPRRFKNQAGHVNPCLLIPSCRLQ